MNNKKSKKKLFAFLGCGFLALVLTAVATVSVTLAYFGEKKTGTAAIKMDQSVEIDSITTDNTTTTEVLPGQRADVDISIQLAVVNDETANENNGSAFIAVKLEFSELGSGDNTSTPSLTLPNNPSWVVYDGWYYYCSNINNDLVTNSTLQAISASSGSPYANLKGTFIVDPKLDNNAANQELTLSITVVAVQAQVFDANGDPITGTIGNAQAMFDQIKAQEASA